jgi:hypothetical protein
VVMVMPVDQRTGFQKLEQMEGVFVNQKMDWMEVMSGCEMPNRYYISPLRVGPTGHTSKMGNFCFKAKEESTCCQRQCVTGDNRELTVRINHLSPNSPTHRMPFLELRKECTCTCMCLSRPTLEVFLVENG